MNKEIKKHHFNIIDAAVIVLVLLVLSFCGYKIYSYYASTTSLENNANASNQAFICSVEVKKIPKAYINDLKIGDNVYNLTGTLLGEITDISFENATETYILTSEGIEKTVSIPDAVDVLVTMRLTTKPENIYVGKYLQFKTPIIKANGHIISRESEK